MKLELDAAGKIMREDGYDISWLNGDRKRYGYFGWENSGRLLKYCITERMTKGIDTKEFTYKKYSGGSKDLKNIIKMHEKDGLGLKRTLADNKLCFGRLRRTTVLALKGKKPAAYINFSKNKWLNDAGTVLEYGGDLKALKALIRRIIDINKYKEIEVFSPPFFNRYTELFVSIASYSILRNDGMIKIIDLKSALKKFTGQMSKKIRGLNLKKTSVTLEIPELCQQATLEIGKTVKVTDKEAKLKISLNRRDMVRFLFGYSKLSDDFNLDVKYSALNIVLPLDVYMTRLETV